MVVLSICILSEPVSLSILFPFVYFMVRDFGVVDDEAQLGYYVGLLASVFSLAQFCTSVFWGWASDRVGRKPVLLIGLLGNTATMLAFGTSTSFRAALICRALCGILNANIGVVKCVLGEICDESNQDLGFSVFGLAWGVGGIIGPMIGGLLANPVTTFPELFAGNAFLTRFPYFFPCAVSAIVSMAGCIAGFAFLEETGPGRRPRAAVPARVDAPSLSHAGAEDETSPLLRSSQSTMVTETRTADHGCPKALMDSPPSTDDEVPVSATYDPAPNVAAEHEAGLGWASYHAVAGYALVALHTTLFDEVFALFAVQPYSRGGLVLTSAQVGASLAVMGGLELLLQLGAYPRFAAHVASLRKLYRRGLVAYPAAYLAFPVVAWLVGGGAMDAARWAALLVAQSARLACSVFVFTPVMTMINNSAHPEHLGRVNGLGQTAAAAVRGIGPAVGTMMYAWSTSAPRPFPINHVLVWIVLAALTAVQLVHSRYLPASLDSKKRRLAQPRGSVEVA
ncbi:hypothetical protein H9P43_009027 [Blastocladiella emersonii ATCC 22665]|nr:hypothetical protein H9P43_009027 [Blastocladiella emersonii ATCC 22665]